jgi:hypothetical protein
MYGSLPCIYFILLSTLMSNATHSVNMQEVFSTSRKIKHKIISIQKYMICCLRLVNIDDIRKRGGGFGR